MRKTFPYYDINVRDDSLETLEEVLTQPLFRPVFAMKCEKGPIGVPTPVATMADAVSIFGAETFNKNNPDYFSRASVFLMQILPYCGAWIIRLGSQTDGVTSLKKASMLLYATIDTDAKTWTWASRALGNDTVEELSRNQFSPSSTPSVGGSLAFSGSPAALTGHETTGNIYGGNVTVEESISAKVLSVDLTANAMGDIDALKALSFPIHDSAGVGSLVSVAVKSISGAEDDETVIVNTFVCEADGSSNLVSINLTDDLPADTTKVEMELTFQNNVPSAASVFYNDTILLDWYFYEALFTEANTAGPTYTVPFMAFEAQYAGKYGNEYGFNLSTDDESMELADFDEIANVLYSLGFVNRPSSSSTTSKVLTKYQNNLFDFGLDADQVDPATLSTFGLDVTMDRYWGSEYPAPITPTVFGDNVKYLLNLIKAEAVAASHDVLSGIMDERPFSVDLVNLETKWFDNTDGDSANWEEVTLDVAAAISYTLSDTTAADGAEGLNSSTNIMLEEGTDGYLDIGGASLDDSAVVDADVAYVWNLDANPEIQDNARYPFNMIIDTGYSMATKLKIISMLGVRDDIKPVLTPWSGSDLTEAESIAATATLMSSIRSYPESVIFGTQTFQACVFGQVGYAANSELYRKQLPATFWYADKLAFMHNLTLIKANPEGKTARVETMKDLNWIPYTDLAKKNLWGAGINYAQYYSRTGLHFASLKSVYEHESSLFTNDSFVNMTLYVKQLLPEVWANHAGRTDSNDVVYADVLDELNTKIEHLLNGTATFTVSMYQTAAEKTAGFEHHIAIELFDDLGQRIWHYDIIGKRLTAAA